MMPHRARREAAWERNLQHVFHQMGIVGLACASSLAASLAEGVSLCDFRLPLVRYRPGSSLGLCPCMCHTWL